MHLLKNYKPVSFFVAFLLVLSSCKTSLVPSYDEAIVNGLTESTSNIMTLFASIEGEGATKENYADFSSSYSATIGQLDALVIQMKSRPMPDSKVLDKVNERLKALNIPNLDADDKAAPSATAMEKVAVTIKKIRDVHKLQGVSGLELQAFKNQCVISLDQALTFENYLKR